MVPNEKEIVLCISDYFRGELLIYFLYIALALVAIVASGWAFKIYTHKALWKAILIVFITGGCAISLVVMRTIEIIPVYKDYKSQSYTLEENCEMCIQEGMNNSLEQKNKVILTTDKGKRINLKITNDYTFETGVAHRATVVYTKNSKHIVWYEILGKTEDGFLVTSPESAEHEDG